MDLKNGSRLISINRSPCECHEGDERYVVLSDFRRHEIPRTPVPEARAMAMAEQESKASASAPMRKSRSTSNYRLSSHANGPTKDVGSLLEQNGERDLLRVLAIRPQLASKPKDNILFEGQMDLQTTFETSYEALARARLDNFRQYQMSLLQNEEKEEAKRTQGDEQDYESRDHQLLTMHDSENGDDDDDPNDDHVGMVPLNGSETQEEAAAPIADFESQPEAIIEQSRLVNGGQNRNSRDSRNVRETHPAGQRFYDGYIDPDLAPLIHYDPNMNRLVTMNPRRRSRYRPSTSLRSGAGGLFGDAQTSSNQNQSHKTSTIRSKRDVSPEMASQGLLHNGSEVNIHEIQQNLEPAPPLLYTEANLRVDAKRKLRDNINLRDHVRENNLISVSPQPNFYTNNRSPSPNLSSSRTRTTTPVQDDVDDQHQKSDEPQQANDDSAAPNQREEIRDNLVNANHKSAQEERESGQHLGSITPSKMERICQHQSINIFSASYLDEPVTHR